MPSPNDLTKDDLNFLLWCLGHIYAESDKMDEPHQNFVRNNHNRVLPKLGDMLERKPNEPTPE